MENVTRHVVLNFRVSVHAWRGSTVKTCIQPRPQGLLLVQNGGRRNPWPRLPKWLQKFVRISSRKHDEMPSFCLNKGFRLQKTNRAATRWKPATSEKAILSCVTWHNTPRFVEYFSSLGQGFLRPPFWSRRRPWGRGWTCIHRETANSCKRQVKLDVGNEIFRHKLRRTVDRLIFGAFLLSPDTACYEHWKIPLNFSLLLFLFNHMPRI